MKTISVRIDDRQFQELVGIEREESIDRSLAVRKIVKLGLTEWKIEKAVEKYVRGEVSSWRAAQLAGVSLRKMLAIFSDRGIEVHYSEESLKEDLKS